MESTKMTLNEKAAQTVRKLLRLTQDGTMDWSRTDADFITRGTDDIIDVAYMGEHSNTHFLVYELRSRCWDENERAYWSNSVVVDLVTPRGELLWRVPQQQAMWDLLEAVRVRAGKVEEKLDTFLNEENA